MVVLHPLSEELTMAFGVIGTETELFVKGSGKGVEVGGNSKLGSNFLQAVVQVAPDKVRK